jgi:SpoVK/Ycf46/Vps4 family AAA+-type ATPase
VDVDFIEDIDKSDSVRDSGFEDLVIPKHYRDLLVALVASHTEDNKQKGKPQSKKPSTQMDLVHGKGRGLVILLHGPPGVGKTSTAETIAAYTKRPLYSITCGDIGLTPEEIENNLSDHFGLANKWGCVLLLDEADVFLMKRDWRDYHRNALVSGMSVLGLHFLDFFFSDRRHSVPASPRVLFRHSLLDNQ